MMKLLTRRCLHKHETVATSLAWAICYLAQHDDKQHLLAQELSAAAELSDNDDLGLEAVTSLPYLDAVIVSASISHSGSC